MATLVGAITFLTLAGTPGLTPYTDTTSFPRTYSADFTRLSISATPTSPSGSFTGKTEESTIYVTVSDTASATATEDPIDTQDITSADLVYATLTESASLANYVAASETAFVTLGEAVTLSITSNTAKAGTDTASATITETASVAVAIDVTDTASVTATEGTPTIDTPANLVSVTDTASVTITDSPQIDIYTGFIPATGEDIASVTLAEVASVAISDAPGQVAGIRLDVRSPTLWLRVL